MSITLDKADILIVEDEALVAEDIKDHIVEMGHRVSAIVDNGEDALLLLEGSRPDLVMMDIVLAGKIDGINVAEVIKERYQIPVIFLTAYTDQEKVKRAQTAEPYGYLVKPFDERELRTTIGMALYKHEADRRLRESQRWSHAVLASISDAVITTDNQGDVHYLNAQAEELTGWNNDSAAGRSLFDVVVITAAEQKTQLQEQVVKLLEMGEITPHTHNIEADIRNSEGGIIPVAFSLATIEYDNGEYAGVVMALRDITVQREARELLENINSELEQRVSERTRQLEETNHALSEALKREEISSQAKSRFLGIITHELRTPLNPAIGYAELLLHDASLSELHREYAQEIMTGCNSLLLLINNMLELAQSETGELTLTQMPFDLESLLRHVTHDFQSRANEKSLALDLAVTTTPLPVVMGDSDKVREILERLLENAVKFTREGKITLQVDIDESDSTQLAARFSLIDTGIGITDEKKAVIFDAFTQGDDSRTRQFNGAGLGLTLCKRLVDLMNGTIGVEDNPGGGSRFWFTLPLTLAD